MGPSPIRRVVCAGWGGNASAGSSAPPDHSRQRVPGVRAIQRVCVGRGQP
ncbi:MAG: hypothetical protein M5U28_54075 [Sandaracinaceae bacterium]|nr:hypothetical protein [Sandaracinaceae bacterium]